MTDTVEKFYKDLSRDYHFIFADWRKSVLRQSEVLDRLIRTQIGATGRSVLDCSCGIGTQAIGLAVRGYTVHGTDLSAEAVARAQQEADAFKVRMSFGVADFRHLESQVDGLFDVVLSCDNSLAHMLTEADLTQAVTSMAGKLKPGGLLLLSIRDYDALAQEQPRSTSPVVSDSDDGRSIVFQVWDWAADGTSYTLSHFTLKQAGPDRDYDTNCRQTTLRAWQRAEIEAALSKSDLTAYEWHMPQATGYHQPILTARKI